MAAELGDDVLWGPCQKPSLEGLSSQAGSEQDVTSGCDRKGGGHMSHNSGAQDALLLFLMFLK